MKKLTLILSALAAVFACSCSKVDVQKPSGEETLVDITFSASRDAVSKASLDGLSVVWAEGDQIAVWDGTQARCFNLIDGAGTNNGLFQGQVASGATSYAAVYPYNSFKSFADGKINVKLPSVQELGGACVSKDALVCVARTDTKNFAFKNLVSLVAFNVEGEGYVGASFRDNNYAALAGTFSYDFAYDTIEGGDASLVKVSGQLQAGSTYYIATLPVECGSGFTVALEKDTRVSHKQTSKPASFLRNGGLKLGAVDTEPLCDKEIADYAALAVWAAEASKYGKDETTTITDDIFFEGSLPSIPSFESNLVSEGVFYDWVNDGTPFIVENKGLVQGINIDASCTLNWPEVTDVENFGFLVAHNTGSVKNCVNAARVDASTLFPDTDKGHTYAGILVGNCEEKGIIEYCACENFEGDNEFNLNIGKVFSQAVYVGTVCGRSSGKGTQIKDCRNNFNFTVTSSTADYSDTPDDYKNPIYIGGITGSTNDWSNALRCTNDGSISINFKNSAKPFVLGGISAYSAGEIENCTNNATLSIESGAFSKAVAMGGISGYQGRPVTGCTNKGDILLNAKSFYGRNSIGSINGKYTADQGYASGTISTACVAVGGLVGYTWGGDNPESPIFEISSSNNYGKISVTYTGMETARLTGAWRMEVGGIVGDAMGNITSCNNYGQSITGVIKATDGQPFDPKTSNGSLTCSACYVGGIAGGDYMSGRAYCTVTGCTNEAVITATNYGKYTTNSTAAGIVAYPGPEGAAVTTKIEGCTNKGSITVNGSTQFRIGGIGGSSGNKISCTNSGNLTCNVVPGTAANDKAYNPQIGGIVGYQKGQIIKNCTNTGNVTLTNGGIIGGLAGQFGGDPFVDFGSNAVNCTVTFPSSGTNYGIINGVFSSAPSSTNREIGSSSAMSKVAGAIVKDGSKTTLSASNYETYLKSAKNYKTSDGSITYKYYVSYGK